MSPDLFARFVIPSIDKGEKHFFILNDNFRFDHWQAVKDIAGEFFTVGGYLFFYLPTATPYARNVYFFGINAETVVWKCFPIYG
jgi:hypothetical protein